MLGANKKKKVSEFATPYTVGNALTKGGATVKLSALVMGLANMAHKQIIKGLIFLAIEIAYIAYMVSAGAYYISMLPSLGPTIPVMPLWNSKTILLAKDLKPCTSKLFKYIKNSYSLFLYKRSA